MRGGAFAAALAAICSLSGIAHGSDDVPAATHAAAPALRDIDELMRLQDEAAAGSLTAAAGQKTLLRSIGMLIAAATGGEASQLATAAAIYVLSGGDPATAEKLAHQQDISPAGRKLLEGTAHFMRGEHAAASASLGNMPTDAMEARLAGRVALAQAMLAKEGARQEHFAFAMSAMPGTLIEESALRRSALDFAMAQDPQRLMARLERYARRFPNSVYGPSFWRELMGAIARRPKDWPQIDLKQLDAVIAPLPPNLRRVIYYELARRFAAAGRPERASLAGRRLARLSAAGSIEQSVGSFYSSLYDIVSPEGEAALRRLAAMPREALDAQELALLEAALTLGGQIMRPPLMPVSGTDEAIENSTVENRGADLLKQSAALIPELDQ